MSESIRWEVLPDEYIEDDETVSADELFNDIMAGFEDLERHAQGVTLLQIIEREVATSPKNILVQGTHLEGVMAPVKYIVANKGKSIPSSLNFLSFDQYSPTVHKVLIHA